MRLGLVGVFVVFLSACSALLEKPPETPAEERWQQRQLALQSITEWSFRGRTVITQDREGWNAGVNWTQQGDFFQIRLTGPFSQGGVDLQGDAQQVTLTMSDGEQYQAATPEQLLNEVIGLRLPVSALRDWVRGLPHQGLETDAQELDDQGRLVSLEQEGWQIAFMRYVPVAGQQLPDKVFIEHADLNVRIAVTSWR
jgi:outer membrane lipoprotein LolB